MSHNYHLVYLVHVSVLCLFVSLSVVLAYLHAFVLKYNCVSLTSEEKDCSSGAAQQCICGVLAYLTEGYESQKDFCFSLFLFFKFKLKAVSVPTRRDLNTVLHLTLCSCPCGPPESDTGCSWR